MRLKDTEFVRSGQEDLKYKTGICIDIFVLDHVPDDPVLRRIIYLYNILLRKISYSEIGKDKGNNILLRGLYHILYKIPRDQVFNLRNIEARKYN